jgi:saccharopine dehydrogenase-like NADP-dependent oxidoreductase
MSHVIVVIGAGQIGQAIARRVGVGKRVLLADRSEANANTAAEIMGNACYEVRVATGHLISVGTSAARAHH